MKNPIEDRRVRKTKKALRQGFAKLLKEKPLKDITIKELVELADIHRGTFYLHYRDIYDLQSQIEDEMMAEFNEVLDQYLPTLSNNTPFPLFLAIMHYIADNADLCRALLGDHGNMSFFKKVSGLVRDRCLNSWMKLYPIDDAETSEYFGFYVVSGCMGVLRHWLERDMQTPAEKIAEMVGNMAMHGSNVLQMKKMQKSSANPYQ